MVRVGGGWMALDEFLVKNDPCRGKCSTGGDALRLMMGGFSHKNFNTEEMVI